MYFNNFQKIYYDFPVKANQDNSLFILTDITSNVRVRKEILENLTLYEEYDILVANIFAPKVTVVVGLIVTGFWI